MADKVQEIGKMDVLIFDMDGVLVDVSRSYRKTIQQAIGIYLRDCLGIKAELVSLEEISLFKSAGGFNNDWDLTAAFLLYLLALSGIPPLRRNKRLPSPDTIVLYLREHLSHLHRRKPLQVNRTRLSSFLENVRISGGGLKGVRSVLGDRWNGWVYGSGGLDRENLIKRIFQEIYLGEQFASHYRLQPLFYRWKGLYLREKLLIEKEILLALRKKLRLGIASGRPRFEAELALKRFHLMECFDALVTLDECETEETRLLAVSKKKVKLTKPHPYSLLRAVKEIGIQNPRCGYIGDTVDDMVAARSAQKYVPIAAIGFLPGRVHRREREKSLLEAGADLLINTPDELLRFKP